MTEQMTKPSPLVSALLESVESRLNDVTEGPWVVTNCSLDCCVWVASESDTDVQLAGFDSWPNAEFIAHARTDISALIALARQQDKKLRDILKLVETAEEDRRIRQDDQPFAQFADSVIGTEEIRDVLNKTSES